MNTYRLRPYLLRSTSSSRLIGVNQGYINGHDRYTVFLYICICSLITLAIVKRTFFIVYILFDLAPNNNNNNKVRCKLTFRVSKSLSSSRGPSTRPRRTAPAGIAGYAHTDLSHVAMQLVSQLPFCDALYQCPNILLETYLLKYI